MNTVIPVAIVLSLGVGSGLILRRWLSGNLLISGLAGLLTVFLWGLGLHVLFALIPSDEPGATHWRGILYVFLVGAAASLITLCLIGKRKQD